MCTAEGKLYMFVGIDRTSKFVVTQLVQKAGKMAAAQFLRDLIAAVTYKAHTVLTDNGIQLQTETAIQVPSNISLTACAASMRSSTG